MSSPSNNRGIINPAGNGLPVGSYCDLADLAALLSLA